MIYDALVIGSGPNGLAAAIRLAERGRSVKLFEARSVVGGGMSSGELTIPGFIHDICSGVHPMGISSPYFMSLKLERFGLKWIHSPVELVHPLKDDPPVMLMRSVEETAKHLGDDGSKYLKIMKPLADRWEELFSDALRPVFRFPRHPLLLARFGLKALLPAETFIKHTYQYERARALVAGIASHANVPLSVWGTGGVGLMLNLAAHANGWPVALGGSQKIADALLACFKSLGGEVETGMEIKSLKDLPQSKMIFFDLGPGQLQYLLEGKIPRRKQKHLSQYQYGPAVFKLDWALNQPIPWKRKECSFAATVHIGGKFEEMLEAESLPVKGKASGRPFILLSQPSLFDSSRAPEGKHTAWAYCHVPHGFREDMTEVIENLIEEYAPGFKQVILKRSVFTPSDFEQKNLNLVGGDISGGLFTFERVFFGPFRGMNPYELPVPGYYICSSTTPPGPGVHGMCGFNAVESAL